MAQQRKPRPRKAAASRARSGGGRVGPLWWGVGALALGWIAFDANRPLVARHVPQLAELGMPWSEPAPPRREAAPARPAPARQAAARPAPHAPAHAAPVRPAMPEARQAAVRPPAPMPKAVLPEARPARAAVTAPATPRPAAAAPGTPGPATGTGLTTRSPVPMRRAPDAAAPVWMVLEPGRPVRVTARQGRFARVESGIFTGWVEAEVLPKAEGRPQTAAQPVPRSTMPVLAADSRRTGPVPAAGVPAARP